MNGSTLRSEDGGGSGDIVLDIGELTRRIEAEEFRDMGHEHHAQGEIEDAAACYRLSLDIFPTAEGHTSLATTLAARGEWEEAAAECERAVALDPDLGNACNDLGVYLAELGRFDEALEWLDRAIASPNYDCPHYPWYHKGRIKEQMGRFMEARDCYARAHEIDPDWAPAWVGYCRALGWLN